MSSSRLLIASAVASAVLAAAPVAATVINFDSAPATFTSYTESGVTFDAAGQTIEAVGFYAGTRSLLASGSPRAPFTATFASLFNGSISIDLGDLGSDADGLFLELYGQGGALLSGSALVISASNASFNTLTASAVGVSFAKFGARAPSANGSSVFADNFTFNAAAPAPEPASWAMMLGGFGMIGGTMRSRRSKVAVSFG